MRNKKVTYMLLYLLGMVMGYCLSSGSIAMAKSGFELKYVKGCSDFDIYQDSEEGVQYIVYTEDFGNNRVAGICPRYNRNGEIYVATK